jgi:hypothetical protein
MMNIKREYETQEQDLAALMAFLTNSSLKHSNGKIALTADHNLKKHIDQLLKEQKFIEANELIRSAKSLHTESSIDAKIISKSYRMPFGTYYQIMSVAIKNDESMSDVFKKILTPSINLTLDELQLDSVVENDKIKSIRQLFLDWTNIKTSNRKLYATFNLWNTEHYDRTNFKKYVLDYLREIILKKCSETEIDNEYSSNMTDKFIKILNSNNLVDISVYFSFDFSGEKITCQIELAIASAIMDDEYQREEFLNILYGDSTGNTNTTNPMFSSYEVAIEGFFDEMQKITSDDEEQYVDKYQHLYDEYKNVIDDLLGDYLDVEMLLNLGTYDVEFESTSLLLDGEELGTVDTIGQIIYERLVSESELLPMSFNVSEVSESVSKALSDDDYESASKYSKELEVHAIIRGVSQSIAEMLKIKSNDSEVITLSMPKTISLIIDLAKDKKSNKVFISEICQNYFEKQVGGL